MTRVQVKEDEKNTKDSTKEEAKAVRETKPEQPAKKNLVYVHEPGTVHLNAYEGAVAEAEAKLNAAKSELEAAKVALEDKKASSQFVEE